MAIESWVNADGVLVGSGGLFGDQDRSYNRARGLNVMGARKQLEMDVDLSLVADAATGYPVDLDNDGTNDGFGDNDAYIPANSAIVSAIFVSGEAAAGGTSVNIGLYQKDGTAIDADGLFAALLTAEMGLGEVSHGDGALVQESGIGAAGVGANDAYIAIANTGTFTAGKGRLIIEYIDPVADS